MDIKKFEDAPRDVIQAEIEKRALEMEGLERWKGWHFERTKLYRNIQKNQERLKALLRDKNE